ncbi:hypothetical protein GCM10009609_12090 [Pseudonocardia aurantiaca]|uniref:Uncharacterized protein n=1 Tax=Pseudonocardia aurantiaca TaxID=75290 RepID=A0ABW4FC48_9PSEU
MGGVEDLVLGREPLINQLEQVLLRAAAQGQPRFVEEQDELLRDGVACRPASKIRRRVVKSGIQSGESGFVMA